MRRVAKKHLRENQRIAEDTAEVVVKYREEYLAGVITTVDVVSIKDQLFRPVYIFTVTRTTGKSVYPIRNLEVAKKLLIALDVIFYVDSDTKFIVQDSNIGEAKYDIRNY